MSTLTTTERDGLEDVFLSIHTNTDKFKKLKDISSLIISLKNDFFVTKLVKHVKYGMKWKKISNIFDIFTKKKKNLSK